ncbi:MAG TPA: hypothetical protein VKU82_12405 [Planctomycetaceae bacterium]|nr:hypothetical protein [Planctomycetaceae bacterium]
MRRINYEFLVKCVSGVLLLLLAVGIIVETDLLPAKIRLPLRIAIHEAGQWLSRLPVVSQIMRALRL